MNSPVSGLGADNSQKALLLLFSLLFYLLSESHPFTRHRLPLSLVLFIHPTVRTDCNIYPMTLLFNPALLFFNSGQRLLERSVLFWSLPPQIPSSPPHVLLPYQFSPCGSFFFTSSWLFTVFFFLSPLIGSLQDTRTHTDQSVLFMHEYSAYFY